MKVALLTLAVPIPGHPSVGLYNIAQCQGVINLGHQARIITCAPLVPRCAGRFSDACARHSMRPSVACQGDVEIHTARVPFVYSRSIRERWTELNPELVQRVFTLAVKHAITKQLRAYQPDILVIHGIYPWGDIAIRFAHSYGLRVVAIEHSGSDIERIARNPSLSSGYRRRAEKINRVFTVNPKMAQLLLEVDVRNVLSIHNGITQFPIKARVPKKESAFTILCAGSYIERKGHTYLLQAFAAAKIPGAKLRLIGRPTPKIAKQIIDLGIRTQVEILPEMSQESLRKEMQHADLFALPSAEEAFGLVFAEALSVGTPILVGEGAGVLNLPYVRESAWVVTPRNTEEIRRALLTAARSVNLGSSHCVLKAKEWIRTHLSWEENARTLLELPSIDATT